MALQRTVNGTTIVRHTRTQARGERYTRGALGGSSSFLAETSCRSDRAEGQKRKQTESSSERQQLRAKPFSFFYCAKCSSLREITTLQNAHTHTRTQLGSRKCGNKVQVLEAPQEPEAKSNKESWRVCKSREKKNGKESYTAAKTTKMTTKMAINAKVCNQKIRIPKHYYLAMPPVSKRRQKNSEISAS